MYGINAFSIISLLVILYSLKLIISQPTKKQQKIFRILLSLVFLLNAYQIYKNPHDIPVEFSTVTYFSTSIIVLLNIKFLRVWAMYSALMSGFFYYLTMILNGGAIYHLYEPLNIYKSLFSHGVMLLYGLYMLRTIEFKKRPYLLMLGNLMIVSWAIYIRPQITINTRLFIYELIDAVHVKSISDSFQVLYVSMYYVVLVITVFYAINLIFKLNSRFTSKGHNDELYIDERVFQKSLKRQSV